MRATSQPQQARLKRYREGTSLPFIRNLDLADADVLRSRALDGDSLSVPSKVDRVANPVAIDGDTDLDELIGWTQGLRLSDVFKDLDADVKPTADLNVSLIVRRKNDFNEIEVLPFSLSKAILFPSTEDNLELRPFDRIVILPQSQAAAAEGLIAGGCGRARSRKFRR